MTGNLHGVKIMYEIFRVLKSTNTAVAQMF